MSEQYANSATSTLASSINSSVTSLNVAGGDGAKFPATGDFRLKIDDEIMLCTARSTDTLTVTRAIEGTSAAAHTAGISVKHVLSLQSLKNFVAAYNLIGAYASRPAAGVEGRSYHPTDVGWITKCVDDGTNWRNFYHGVELITPSTSGWTWRNQGSAVRTDNYASILIECKDTGSSANKRLQYRSLPSAPYKITLAFAGYPLARAIDGQSQGVNVGLYESSSGKSSICGMSGANNQAILGFYRINGDDSFNAFEFGSQNVDYIPTQVWWVQIEDNNTNRYWRTSRDGTDWYDQSNVSRTAFITPDNFIFGAHNYLASMRLIHYKVE